MMRRVALLTTLARYSQKVASQGILGGFSPLIPVNDGRNDAFPLNTGKASSDGAHIFGAQGEVPTPSPTSDALFVPVSVLQIGTRMKFCGVPCGIFHNDASVVVGTNGRFRSAGERSVAYAIAANVPYVRPGETLQSASFVAVISSNETLSPTWQPDSVEQRGDSGEKTPPAPSSVSTSTPTAHVPASLPHRAPIVNATEVATRFSAPSTAPTAAAPTAAPSRNPKPAIVPGAQCDTIIHAIIEISLRSAGIYDDPLGRPLSTNTPSVMALAVDTTRSLEWAVTSGRVEENLAQVDFRPSGGICMKPYHTDYHVAMARVPATPYKPFEIDRCNARFASGGWSNLGPRILHHLLAHSLTHSLTHSHSLTHALTHSLTHSPQIINVVRSTRPLSSP